MEGNGSTKIGRGSSEVGKAANGKYARNDFIRNR